MISPIHLEMYVRLPVKHISKMLCIRQRPAHLYVSCLFLPSSADKLVEILGIPRPPRSKVIG